MSRLILVATSSNALLPMADDLEEQFGCLTHTINLNTGLTNMDEDILDDGFDAALIELDLTTLSADLAFIIRELRSRNNETHIILVGPHHPNFTHLERFPFLARHQGTMDFIDPTDMRRYPDEMNRVLRKIFPKLTPHQSVIARAAN